MKLKKNSFIVRFLFVLLLLGTLKTAVSQESILFSIDNISRFDERIVFVYNLLNDGRFEVVPDNVEGQLIVSANKAFDGIDLEETFADFQERNAKAFSMMDKEQASELAKKYKSSLPIGIITSLMVDYYIDSRENRSCSSAFQLCLDGGPYAFPNGVNSGSGESGPNYDCLSTTPNPAWYYIRVANPGEIILDITSTPSHDIDFCCWGPFDDPVTPCPYGLTSDKVVSCSYAAAQIETCTIPSSAQTGDYYILVITNYSNQVGDIVINQAGGEGSFQCADCYINATALPEYGGIVTGAGWYYEGDTCVLTALPNTNSSFLYWKENDTLVSSESSYAFTVNGSRTLVANFQVQIQNYTVTVLTNPTEGGTVTGGGVFDYGQSCTLIASAATGYTFANWTSNGHVVSTQASYTFSVYDNRTLVANFTQQPYTITVTANPTNGGNVSGTGTYYYGQTCTVTASAATGYNFVKWTENGTQVSTNEIYTFMVARNRSLNAVFESSAPPEEGFSVRNGFKVYFSRGNLQHQASSDTWRFAEHQYDYIGEENSNISSYYNGWIDLFGWGTSGYYQGAVCYEPWSTSTNYLDYYSQANLLDNADWGYNRISNGFNQYHCWRTLSADEWRYVLFNRSTSSGIRFVKAVINNNNNGIILLPDAWDASVFSFNNPNEVEANYNSNRLSLSQWSTLENNGAIFLPAAGYRKGTMVSEVGMTGNYWTNRNYDEIFVNCLSFDNGSEQIAYLNRYCGRSVRLVRNVYTDVSEMEEDNVMVYPNPTNGRVVIESDQLKHIRIINPIGQVIYEGDIENDRAEYDLSKYGTGIYCICVEMATIAIVKRIVVVGN